MFQARVTGLVMDENRRVIGVKAEERTGAIRVRARKGVILATGGFGRNPKMLEVIDPRYSTVPVIMGKGHTGDGHRMAEEMGAYLKDMDYVKPNFGLHVTGTSVVERLLIFYLGAIIVNKNGVRFVNESLPYKDIGIAALNQPDDTGFQIFDQKIYDLGVKNAKSLGETMSAVTGGMALNDERIKLLVRVDTIEELAFRIGVPSLALKDTIDRYNSYVDMGRDADFGRTALTKQWGKIVKIDTPPFYAFQSKPAFVATYGGIAVNKDMQVLTAHDKITGLYAAGELIGGFHGASYVTGTSIGKSVIFGRIAGRNVANAV
ncbi:FAD-binding protein [Chloroflexota bacterium]